MSKELKNLSVGDLIYVFESNKNKPSDYPMGIVIEDNLRKSFFSYKIMWLSNNVWSEYYSLFDLVNWGYKVL